MQWSNAGSWVEVTMKYWAVLLILLCSCLPSSRVESLPTTPTSDCHSWNKFPIHVRLDTTALELRTEMNMAMLEWNEALGRQAFVWADGTTIEVNVEVGQLGTGFNQTEKGYDGRECLQGAVYHTLRFRPGLDEDELHAFALHELGHVLGLAHSLNEKSIMHWIVDASLMGKWDDEHDPRWYRILKTDADTANSLHK